MSTEDKKECISWTDSSQLWS